MMALLKQQLIVIRLEKEITMKKYLIILMIFGYGCASAQTTNILAPYEFESISINGQSINSIWLTEGDRMGIQNLFGTATEIRVGDDTPGHSSITYDYIGFTISISEIITARGNLSGFEIKNQTATLIVNGTSITIGDNINKLGGVNINNMLTGGKSILFVSSDDPTSVLSIRYDPNTNIVTSIKFYVIT